MNDLKIDIDPGLCGFLDRESAAFLERMYAGGLDRYERRLKALGFVGMKSVMDAGCGFGQWSLALTKYNGEVWGVDIAEDRVRCAESIAKQNNFRNVHFKCSALEDLDFPNEYFDGIFCYSTIYHTDETKTLDEFSRVIKPNGLLYLNFNSVGWFIYLLWRRGLLGLHYHSLKRSLQALASLLKGRKTGYHVTTVRGITQALTQRGFRILAADGDGRIVTNQNVPRVQPFFAKYHLGLECVWEVLAKKEDFRSGVAANQPLVPDFES